jgi:hypothetical protein
VTAGYAVRLRKDKVLDCFDYCVKNECWASYANSPLHLIDTHPIFDQDLGANAVLRIYPQNNSAYLIATEDIRIEEEVLWHYGHGYKYSEHIK